MPMEARAVMSPVQIPFSGIAASAPLVKHGFQFTESAIAKTIGTNNFQRMGLSA
jgi:hypothetical protein